MRGECTHNLYKCRDRFTVTPDHPCGAGGAWESSVAAKTASRIPPQGRASVSEPFILGRLVSSQSRCPLLVVRLEELSQRSNSVCLASLPRQLCGPRNVAGIEGTDDRARACRGNPSTGLDEFGQVRMSRVQIA